jgi:glycosyltransferase involved in cell wall biosynthesis
LRILLLHNHYRQAGGEDVAMTREQALLATYGHHVRSYTVSNDSVRSWREAIATACFVPYSPGARKRVSIEIERFRPDIVHVHNFFPLLSPSIYDSCRAAGVPVVQSLHNYRLVCANAMLFRDGHVCEDCLGKAVALPGVIHGCYRGRAASAPVAAMIMLHRLLGTWCHKVNMYIAPTEFCRGKFIQAGIRPEKIAVKPNFVHPDPGPGDGSGEYALFVGRLTREKGLLTLLRAWQSLHGQIQLKVVGDGPLAPQVCAAARRMSGVDWVGPQSTERVLELMKAARVLIVPSLWYEICPIVIAEAYAVGLPVIAANIGTLRSLVDHGRTGLLFNPDDSADLAEKATWFWMNPHVVEMRQAARREFERTFTPARNYEILLAIYGQAIRSLERGSAHRE